MELNFATVSAWIGIIVGILGILNQLHNLRKEQTESIKAQAAREQQIDDKLKVIDEKLEIHNAYAEKFNDISLAITEIKNDIKWIRGQK